MWKIPSSPGSPCNFRLSDTISLYGESFNSSTLAEFHTTIWVQEWAPGTNGHYCCPCSKWHCVKPGVTSQYVGKYLLYHSRLNHLWNKSLRKYSLAWGLRPPITVCTHLGVCMVKLPFQGKAQSLPKVCNLLTVPYHSHQT